MFLSQLTLNPVIAPCAGQKSGVPTSYIEL